MTLDGVAYELPTWELLISVPACSSLPDDVLLPTPSANDRTGAESTEQRRSRDAGGSQLADLPLLLPTPAAEEARGTAEQHLARKKKSDGYERKTVTGLGILVKTLPTPTASDAHSAGSRNLPGSKSKPGVSLTDIVRTGDSTTSRLLPTPAARDGKGRDIQREGGTSLPEAMHTLLPTPTTHASTRGKGDAERYKGPKSQGSRRSNLEDAIEAVEGEVEWIGVSSSQPSLAGSPSLEPHPNQLTIEADSVPDFPSGCSDSPKDGPTSRE